MEFIKSACYFIAVLSALVIAHEWGHYIVAKMCGMRVDDFSLFFGKKIVCLGKRNGTEYNIRMIPLGGFVKIAGMEPEDLGSPVLPLQGGTDKGANSPILVGLQSDAISQIDPTKVSDRVASAVANSIGEDNKLTLWGVSELQSLEASTALTADETAYLRTILETRDYRPDPDGYNQKPIWKRAITIAAGPIVSVLFGYFILCTMGLTTGLPDGIPQPIVEAVVKDSAAAAAGLHPGDKIVNIDNTPIKDGIVMINIIHGSAGKLLHFTVDRGGKRLAFDITPKSSVLSGSGGHAVGLIGIQPAQQTVFTTFPATPTGVKQSVLKGTMYTEAEISGIVSMFVSHRDEIKENVGGIMRIASQIHEDSKEGPSHVLLTGAILSISLGVLNLLPIPILDGGHLLMLTVEAVRRRKLSLREVNAFSMVGMSIIGVLFLLVMYLDIVKLFFKK